MSIEAGQLLLHYRLIEKIGEGGMGVVWKALDTTLDREVAIKVLPSAVSQETERLARFEREAKLLGSLQHSNIATVYGLHPSTSAELPCFIAMEYVPGEDLAQRLARGPLPVEDALITAQRVAEALEVAHESGVIHRDLKPANVKLTADGKVKVLDFGLAKAFDADPTSGEPASPSMSPTLTSAGTAAGMILGTAAYMSPEQAKGKPVDRRADIWAFGALVMEMLTGKKLFDAETVSETLAQVLMTPVGFDVLPDATPPSVRRLLGRCLERDPSRRLRDIGEARIVLEDVNAGAVSADDVTSDGRSDAPAIRRSRLGVLLPWAVALVAAALAVTSWFSTPRHDESSAARIVTSILPPAETGFDMRRGMALSPDGTRIVFPARKAEEPRRLWIRELDRTAAQMLQGTEGAEAPFWSPDGRQVGFFADGNLKRIALESGLIETVGEVPYVGGAAWTRDGYILMSSGWGRGIQKVSVSGGAAELVAGRDSTGSDTMVWPSLLPDGKHFIYLVRRYGSDQRTGEVRLGSMDGSLTKVLLHTNSNAVYAEPGHLVWWHDGNLRAQRFDIEQLELVGEAAALIPGVRFYPWLGRTAIAVSDNGLLLYQEGGSHGGDELVLVDRQGAVQRTLGDPGSYYGPRLSSDGRHITLDISDQTNRGDIWMLDVARGSGTRLTFFSEDDSRSRWSPDGRRIAFTSAKGTDKFALWLCDSRAGAEPRMLLEDPEAHLEPNDWASNDFLILVREGEKGKDLYTYSFTDEQLLPWITTPFVERAATASPDGRFAAYVSDETGRFEVWVQTFPVPGTRWRVSVDGGDWPAWRADGKEIYYVDPAGQIIAVPVSWREDENGRVPEFGTPQELFRVDFKGHEDRQYDTLDGETFLLNRVVLEGARDPLTLVQNWKQQ